MFLHVELGSFVGMMPGVKRVPPCRMCMMRRFFVRSTFMMLSCFAVVACGMRMVFRRLPIVLGCFLGHGSVFLRFVAPATHYSSVNYEGSHRPFCRGPSRTSGGIQSRSRSWITGRRQSGVISSVASVIGSLKRRLPALPGFK
jgi:hypothetical protein